MAGAAAAAPVEELAPPESGASSASSGRIDAPPLLHASNHLCSEEVHVPFLSEAEHPALALDVTFI